MVVAHGLCLLLCLAACSEGVQLQPSESFQTDLFEFPKRHSIDMLFVIDDSPRMCGRLRYIQYQLAAFLETLSPFHEDVHWAVISTDLRAPDGGGRFRREPGALADCAPQIDTSACTSLQLEPVQRMTELYADPNAVERLQQRVTCLGLVGAGGDSQGMGLEAMYQALFGEVNEKQLWRQGSKLVVIFLTASNDCSDGTTATQLGEVYAGGERACELERNIEDSCTYADPDADQRIEGERLELGGVERSARAWCVRGVREEVEALSSELALDCPDGGCRSKLRPRRFYYDALQEAAARKLGRCRDDAPSCRKEDPSTWVDAPIEEFELNGRDVVVAAITFPDDGRRLSLSQPLEPKLCMGAGFPGYRYELFAEMFEAHIVFPICEAEQPTAWHSELESLFGPTPEPQPLCLSKRPSCERDEDCGPTGRCAEQVYLPGTDYSFRACSPFEVKVEARMLDAPAQWVELEEGREYSVELASCNYQQPVGVRLLVGDVLELRVSYRHP